MTPRKIQLQRPTKELLPSTSIEINLSKKRISFLHTAWRTSYHTPQPNLYKDCYITQTYHSIDAKTWLSEDQPSAGAEDFWFPGSFSNIRPPVLKLVNFC